MANDIIFNWMLDLRKKEVHPVERGVIIDKYLKDCKLTQKSLADQLGIARTTLSDWMAFSRLSKDQYDGYIRQGMTERQIRSIVRTLNYKKVERFTNPLDSDLQTCITLINKHIPNKVDKTENTPRLVFKLRDTVNRLDMYVKKNIGNGYD